jgi:hypothetical protein
MKNIVLLCVSKKRRKLAGNPGWDMGWGEL